MQTASARLCPYPLHYFSSTFFPHISTISLPPSLLFYTLVFSIKLSNNIFADSIFGAFLFGLIMPRDSHLFKECNEKIEELVLSLTLPLYFALSGLKTDVTQINTGAQGAMVVLVCFVATIGKVRHYFILSHPVISSPQTTFLFLRFCCLTFYYYRYPQYLIIIKNESASVNQPLFTFF